MTILTSSKSKLNYSCATSGEILREYQQLNTPLSEKASAFHLREAFLYV